MSSETNRAISLASQVSLEQMTPFERTGYVAALAGTSEANALALSAFETSAGMTVYPVASSLWSPKRIEDRLDVEGSEITRTKDAPGSLTVTAHLVELAPDPADRSGGQARLFQVAGSFQPELPSARADFHRTIVSGLDQSSYVNLDNRGNAPYEKTNALDEAAWYTRRSFNDRPDQHRLLAVPDTEIHTREVGRDTLNHEVGVQVSLSGPVQAELSRDQFLRVTNSSVSAGPGRYTRTDLALGEPLPKHSERDYTRIPIDADITPDESGRLRAVAEGAQTSTDLTPNISTDEIAGMLSDETISWRDVTSVIINENNLAGFIARVLPFAKDGFELNASRARETVQSAYQHEDYRLIVAGCLGVAAMLGDRDAAHVFTARPTSTDLWSKVERHHFR